MPTFIVHTLPQTVAAFAAAAETGSQALVASPAEAVHAMGAGYFLTMVAAARRAVPGAPCQTALDCGSAPGLALAALRAGAEAVRLDAPPEVLRKLSDIAGHVGAGIMTCWPPPILDLGTADNPTDEARAFLLAPRR